MSMSKQPKRLCDQVGLGISSSGSGTGSGTGVELGNVVNSGPGVPAAVESMGCSEIGAPSTVPLTAPSRTWFSTVSTAGTPAPGAAGAAATGATAGAGAATGATCRGTGDVGGAGVPGFDIVLFSK